MIHNILPSMIGQLLATGTTCVAVQGVLEQIGNGTSNQSYAPAYGLYDYSFYACIWLDTEFSGGSGNERNIQGIQYEVAGYTTPYTYSNVSVYAAHVVEDIFPSSPAVDNSDMTLSDETLVYSGNLTISSSGFNTLNFSTPFCYNGTSNLLLRFENRDGQWNSGYGWGEYDFSPAISRVAYKYQDNSYPTGTGNRSNSRINIKFDY